MFFDLVATFILVFLASMLPGLLDAVPFGHEKLLPSRIAWLRLESNRTYHMKLAIEERILLKLVSNDC